MYNQTVGVRRIYSSESRFNTQRLADWHSSRYHQAAATPLCRHDFQTAVIASTHPTHNAIVAVPDRLCFHRLFSAMTSHLSVTLCCRRDRVHSRDKLHRRTSPATPRYVSLRHTIRLPPGLGYAYLPRGDTWLTSNRGMQLRECVLQEHSVECVMPQLPRAYVASALTVLYWQRLSGV